MIIWIGPKYKSSTGKRYGDIQKTSHIMKNLSLYILSSNEWWVLCCSSQPALGIVNNSDFNNCKSHQFLNYMILIIFSYAYLYLLYILYIFWFNVQIICCVIVHALILCFIYCHVFCKCFASNTTDCTKTRYPKLQNSWKQKWWIPGVCVRGWES
jgi:hypothetical protein